MNLGPSTKSEANPPMDGHVGSIYGLVYLLAATLMTYMKAMPTMPRPTMTSFFLPVTAMVRESLGDSEAKPQLLGNCTRGGV